MTDGVMDAVAPEADIASVATSSPTTPIAPTRRTVRLSPAGRGVILFAFAAFNLSWVSDGAVALYASVSVALLAVVPFLAWLHARGLRVLQPGAVTAFVGETFPLEIPVVNSLRALAARDVVVLHHSARRDAERPAGYVATIAPQARVGVATAQRLTRRGHHRHLSVAVESAFPLGLAVCRAEFVLPVDLLVLPRLGTIRNLDALTAHRHGMLYQGATHRGDEQEFHGLREWRDGESQRRVHWKLSASRGRLLVREFRGEDRPPVHVVLDTRLPPRPRPFGRVSGRVAGRANERRGAFERAVSLAATLVEQNLRRQRCVRMTIVGERCTTFERRRGRAALFPILEALADVDSEPLSGERSIAEFSSLSAGRDEITLYVCVGGTNGDVTNGGVTDGSAHGDLDAPSGVVVLDVSQRRVSQIFVRTRAAGSMSALGRRG